MRSYGIVQGRLLPPQDDFIQSFPRLHWRDEFPLAKQVGASHIEWIITPSCNLYTQHLNPIFTEGLPSDVPVSGICMDDLISYAFTSKTYRQFHLDAAFERAASLGINRVVLPLLEDASVRDPGIRRDALDDIVVVMDQYPDVIVSLETDLDVSNLLSAVRFLGLGRTFITLDTGNLVKQGQDLADHAASVGDYVDGIHIKDCTHDGRTVKLGTGNTSLRSVLPWLMRVPSLRWTTFQTARGEDGLECDTFLSNSRYIEDILDGPSEH